ncbi:MAG: phytoene dehydrogenase [Pelagibacteraceae bacterium TMED65]|nr:phytoene dehydrogenase [Rickettsiales bacterium]OUU52153.1 MAG: phytoene dehydrogenase [Pelagibacteraceae bacterium TMED65]|tara:strand:- start:716 stop:2197 length:1482 start_codon:yes stop_codon:yes gene_type:complete
MNKTAIIVGSGFGGIAASLRMRSLGYQVSIFEKLNQLGGRARVFKKSGFTFDAGPTVITAPFLFDELFKLFNKNRKDYVDFVKLEPWYRFYFSSNNKFFNYSSSLRETEKEIAKFNNSDVEGYRKLLEISEKIFNVGFEKLSFVPFHNFFFMIKQIPTLIKLKSYLSVYKLVSKYIKNEQIRQAFSIQPLLLGGNPLDTTSIYNLIHFLERKWGVFYAMGGTGKIIQGFEKLMKEEQIKIFKNTEVTEIITNGNIAEGIKVGDKKIFADKLIINSDPAYTYKNLIQSNKKKWTDKKIANMEYSMGLFVIYFGTTKKYKNVAHHTIWMGKRYEGLLKDIFKNRILADDFSLYLHRPTATDKSMAPKNCDCFYVLSPVPNLKNPINWGQEGKTYERKILEALDQTILPGLIKNLKICFHMTPNDFQKDYNSLYGSGFSISPIFTQSAWFRFHNKSENFKNLYFVGAGSHPGAGVPGVISSAKVLENIVSNESATY